MKATRQIILFLILVLTGSCIEKFVPEVEEEKEMLVVEGLITDQPVAYTVKLSKSLPLGRKNIAKPVKGATVTITDDKGSVYSFKESVIGTYTTDPAKFTAKIGRIYTLHISNPNAGGGQYESFPMTMKAVPPIDSLYYEKKTIVEKDEGSLAVEGCQVYINTHDPANVCKFYRWEYAETWEFRLPYSVPNRVCWLSANSGEINIKNTSAFTESRIKEYPLNFISNETDRLKVKYSMLVSQYSLNEDEYSYWEKLQNVAEQVGGLYDITPASIPSNVYCIGNPNDKVLGYFSVSAVSSKRIFIKDFFAGQINLYRECPADTILGRGPIPGLNISVWVIEDNSGDTPPTRVITYTRGCADCTVRGTNVRPDFWNEGK
jgi:hypothetical protein